MAMIPTTFTATIYKYSIMILGFVTVACLMIKYFSTWKWSKLKRAFRSSQTVDGDDAIAADAIKQLQCLMDEVDESLKVSFQNMHQGNPNETFLRFLKATDGNVAKAHKMLVDCLQRRKENATGEILAEGASSRIVMGKDFFRSDMADSSSSAPLDSKEFVEKAPLDVLERGNQSEEDPCRSRRVRRGHGRRTRKKEKEAREKEAHQTEAMREIKQAIQPTPLLTGLRNHPSIYIRLGQPPPEHNLESQIVWKRAFNICTNAAKAYKRLLKKAGFGDFLRIQPVAINLGGYISALAERYFPETHTLHLGTFEIGPTPLAWTMITGIRFGGKDISGPRTHISVAECARLLGLKSVEGVFSMDKLKLDALCPPTLDFSKDPAKEDSDWMFRRLIVYLLGSCFFSGPDLMVPIRLVSAMRDIEEIEQYNWGEATFSAFLRGMRQKTSDCFGAFSGFYPFLLFWAYEHLPCMRPVTEWGLDTFPRARRWQSAQMEARTPTDFILYRLELEYLEEDEVNFDAYKELMSDDFRYERAISRMRKAFLGLESWEVYLGERNLRQFGGKVQVPLPPPPKLFGDIQPHHIDRLPSGLLVGESAWEFVEDEGYDYIEWFRTHSLGRIISLKHVRGQGILGGRLVELWLRVHQDGHKVVCPQALQGIEDETKKWKAKYESAKAESEEALRSFALEFAEDLKKNIRFKLEEALKSFRLELEEGLKKNICLKLEDELKKSNCLMTGMDSWKATAKLMQRENWKRRGLSS